MPQKSGFFDTTADDQRYYAAREFAEYFAQFIGNGIFKGGTNLKVTVSGKDSNVSIAVGRGWINGYIYSVYDAPLVLPIKAATNQDRIDRVVLRLDVSKPVRAIKAVVLQGTAAPQPVVPSIVRSGDIYDLSLAQIRVKANTTVIAPDQVTDERLNNDVCGIVTGVVEQADTRTIFDEFQSWLTTKTTEYQSQWREFMQEVQDEGFATTEYVDQKATEKATAAETNAKAHFDNNTSVVKVRTPAEGITDLNQFTTTGFYQLGQASSYQNIPAGMDWSILEVLAYPSGYIIQRLTSVVNQRTVFRTRTEQDAGWNTWAPYDVGQLVRVNQGKLEFFDGTGWKQVSGSSQIMIPSNNVKYQHAEEYVFEQQSSTGLPAIKLYTFQPNTKGTFRISAEVLVDTTTSSSTFLLGLESRSADQGGLTKGGSSRAGNDNQTTVRSFFLPNGTGVHYDNTGDAMSANGGVNAQVANNTYKQFTMDVAMTGDFPVSVFAVCRQASNPAQWTLKARNIKVSYDLI